MFNNWCKYLHQYCFLQKHMIIYLKNNIFVTEQSMCRHLTNFQSLYLLFFIKFLFFTKWQPFKNYEKSCLFHLKSTFRSQHILIFVFPYFLLFLLVSHCLRGWSKINLKVYDINNCLNKNLITHFVWYLGKEKRYDIETLSNDRVLNKKHFYGKIMEKMCTKS